MAPKEKSPAKPANTPSRASTRISTQRARANPAPSAPSQTQQPATTKRGRKPMKQINEDEPEDDLPGEEDDTTPSVPSQSQPTNGKSRPKPKAKPAASKAKPKPPTKARKPTKAQEKAAEAERIAEEKKKKKEQEEEDEDLLDENEETVPTVLPPPRKAVGGRRSTRESRSPARLGYTAPETPSGRGGGARGRERGRNWRAVSATPLRELQLPPPAATGALKSPIKPTKATGTPPETVEEEPGSYEEEMQSSAKERESTEARGEQRKEEEDARKKEEGDAREKIEKEEAKRKAEERREEQRQPTRQVISEDHSDFKDEDEINQTEQSEVAVNGTVAAGPETVIEQAVPTPTTASKFPVILTKTSTNQCCKRFHPNEECRVRLSQL